VRLESSLYTVFIATVYAAQLFSVRRHTDCNYGFIILVTFSWDGASWWKLRGLQWCSINH